MKRVGVTLGGMITGQGKQADIHIGTPFRSTSRPVFVSATFCAFALYWLSSLILEARNASTHFGADAHVYALLAQGVAVDGLTRFHPVTIVLGLAWMKLTSPLALWIAPAHLLKALFAAVGAVGVWAAMSAFAAVMPRRYAVLFSMIYAVSLGSWYCSSVEESKIVTTTLSTLYIATYLQLRKNWTKGGVALLTAILLAACLNEIVAGFLVVIPAVDTLVRRGFGLRHGRWITVHGIAIPLAFVLLEFVVNGRLVAAEANPSRASHLSMLLHYLSRNEFSVASLYEFLMQWLFFNIAAPSPDATYGADSSLHFAGNFAPSLASYFSSPVSASLVLPAGVIGLAAVWPSHRPADTGELVCHPSGASRLRVPSRRVLLRVPPGRAASQQWSNYACTSANRRHPVYGLALPGQADIARGLCHPFAHSQRHFHHWSIIAPSCSPVGWLMRPRGRRRP